MISVQTMTPDVLSNFSRDYQLFCAIFDGVYNYSKTAIDNMHFYDLNIDDKFLELRAATMNFSTEHEWTLGDLETITYSFKSLLRKKGTEEALTYCLTLFAKMRGEDDWSFRVDYDKDGTILIYVPKNISTLGQLEDVLKYIIPAGAVYRIIHTNVFSDEPFEQYFAVEQDVKPVIRDYDQSHVITNTTQVGQNVSGKWSFNSEGEIIDYYQGKFSQLTVSGDKEG